MNGSPPQSVRTPAVCAMCDAAAVMSHVRCPPPFFFDESGVSRLLLLLLLLPELPELPAVVVADPSLDSEGLLGRVRESTRKTAPPLSRGRATHDLSPPPPSAQ